MKPALLVLVVSACASAPRVPTARFVNGPPVLVVNDRRDVPVPPKERESSQDLYDFDGSFFRLLTRALEVPAPQRAIGINSLDEVPDSTWFTNRIGVRDLTPDEVRRGPSTIGSPELHKPWTIHGTKVGGDAIGFIITDARGEKYIVKLEKPEHPELETAADAIVSRLFWAFGFNVPEDHVVFVRPDELVLAKDATIRDVFGNKRPLTRSELDRRLAEARLDAHGNLRALASRYLAGKPLGGHPQRGVRDDDPNDRIAHERRRDLRGARALHAWLDQTDVKEANTLDMWVADRDDPKRHYVKHYFVDFGKSLGAMASSHESKREGVEYTLDWSSMLGNFFSLGIGGHAWDDRTAPRLVGLGLYDTATFDPGAWKPSTQAYLPFRTADRLDNFWAAKILIRFTRPQLAAAVEAGRYSDPRTASYVLDALVARQRATARYWFERVNPVDRFAFEGDRLCFTDLALEYALASRVTTRYSLAIFDRDGSLLPALTEIAPATERTCVALTVTDYAILSIETRRPARIGATYVHIAPDAMGTPRVIGVWRE
ncbi:MAG: hypothetical protein AB7T06_14670 [Kofleriaceae bacterium]